MPSVYLTVPYSCVNDWINMWPKNEWIPVFKIFLSQCRWCDIHWFYKSNNSGRCPMVQGEHPLQRGLLPGQHRHVFDQSGREGKAGSPGWRAGSSKSTEGTIALLLTHSQHLPTNPIYSHISALCSYCSGPGTASERAPGESNNGNNRLVPCLYCWRDHQLSPGYWPLLYSQLHQQVRPFLISSQLISKSHNGFEVCQVKIMCF